MKTIRVAIAGLGTVGRETVRLLRQRVPSVELAAVADRDAAREARALRLPASVARYRDPLRMAREADADIFVELLGGYGAPLAFARTALDRGRALVTANKRLLAYAWPKLMRPGARISFEGSVAGGIPVLRALELSLAGDRITGLDGILNGTTNYILTRCEEGLSAEAALAEAQELGFAEKDPTMDVSGQDAAQKLSVLAGMVTGGWLKPGSFPVAGIQDVLASDVEYAKRRLGRTVRLIASLRIHQGSVAAEVSPALVPLSHPLAAVRRQYNALFIHAASAGDLMFYGRGAGAGPTASAVLADIFVSARDLQGGRPAPRPAPRPLRAARADDAESAYYLRLELADKPGVLARIADALGRQGVSIAGIHQEQAPGGARAVPVMITTHETTRGRFEAARRRILALGGVSRRHCAMRLWA